MAVPRINALYFGQHGDAGNAGTTPDAAKLTISACLAIIQALIDGDDANKPADDNRWAVICCDSGLYFEDLPIPAYVHVDMRMAFFSGASTLGDEARLSVGQHVGTTGDAVTKSAGGGSAYYSADHVQAFAGGGAVCTSGTLHVDIAQAETVATAVDLLKTDGGRIVARIGVMESVSGLFGAPALARCVSGSMDLDIGAIAGAVGDTVGVKVDAGTVNARVGPLTTDIAWQVATGATLNINAIEVTGTKTAAGGSTVNESVVVP